MFKLYIFSTTNRRISINCMVSRNRWYFNDYFVYRKLWFITLVTSSFKLAARMFGKYWLCAKDYRHMYYLFSVCYCSLKKRSYNSLFLILVSHQTGIGTKMMYTGLQKWIYINEKQVVRIKLIVYKPNNNNIIYTVHLIFKISVHNIRLKFMYMYFRLSM